MKLLAALVGLFCIPVACSAETGTNDIDTVVLMVVDDLGWSDLGFRGSGIQTPNLDGIARAGAVLDQYHVCRACSPTRASLMTSRYVTRYGLQSGVLEPAKPYGVPLNETFLPQRLPSGWTKHAIGKWHLGYFEWPYTPTFRGFESYFGYYSGGEDYFTHIAYNGGFDLQLQEGARCGPGCAQADWASQGRYSTHLYTERAQEVLNRTKPDEKVFVYLAYQAVHCPAEVPKQYSDPYNFSNPQRNVFAGMLAALDEGVGNITRTLRELGRWDSTLFVVTSDNGAPTTGCGGAQGGQNWPLRGGKCSAWAGGNRVVSFAKGPGIPAGSTVSDLAHAVDWGVTILSFIGAETNRTRPDGFPLDGVDLGPALRGETNGRPARDDVLLEADPYAYPYTPGFNGDQHSTPYYAIRTAKYKLMIGDPGQPGILDAYYCTGPPCPASHDNKANASAAPKYNISTVLLYDLEADPYETTNIAAQYPQIVRDLTRRVLSYNMSAASSAKQGLPNDPAADPKLHNGTVWPYH